MGAGMDLRQLRHFIAVVEQGAFSRAAQQVHLTQPALTRSIRTLEDMVGASLLDRGSSGVRCTRAGLAMYQHAKFMVAEADRARREVRLAAEGLDGELTLAVGEIFIEGDIHQALAGLFTEGRNVALTVRQVFIEQAVPLILDGQVDLAVTSVPAARMQPGLAFEPLLPVPFAIFAGPDHPLAVAGPISIAELTRWRWAMLDHPHAADFLTRYFAAGRQPLPSAMVRSDVLGLLRSLVLQEGFLALLPRMAMAGQPAVMLQAPDMPVLRQAGLLYRAGQPLRPLVAHAAGLLRAALSAPQSAVMLPAG